MKSKSVIQSAGLLVFAGILHISGASAGTESVLYSFCSQPQCTDGAAPAGGLININGMLYGTTADGGNAPCCTEETGDGVVFSINRRTRKETVVYTFCTQHCGYYLDGINPAASLLNVKGMLYGTTSSGGPYLAGVIYSLNPGTGAEQVAYAFQNGSDGAYPLAGLIYINGNLYGTTSRGGGACSDCGTVFSFNLATGVEKVIHSFQDGTDGAYPTAGLINVGGKLYGTTSEGGGNGCNLGCGTVFSVNPTTGAETVVHSFCPLANTNCPDGTVPYAGLINVGGILYGTTNEGGPYCGGAGCGAVFSLNPKTNAEAVVYGFRNGTDGAYPYAGLINVKGTLYGTTGGGGFASDGTVFSLNPTTGAETVLHAFGGIPAGDGAGPGAGLTNVGGVLYGTTAGGGVLGCTGGDGGCGTVFSVTP